MVSQSVWFLMVYRNAHAYLYRRVWTQVSGTRKDPRMDVRTRGAWLAFCLALLILGRAARAGFAVGVRACSKSNLHRHAEHVRTGCAGTSQQSQGESHETVHRIRPAACVCTHCRGNVSGGLSNVHTVRGTVSNACWAMNH